MIEDTGKGSTILEPGIQPRPPGEQRLVCDLHVVRVHHHQTAVREDVERPRRSHVTGRRDLGPPGTATYPGAILVGGETQQQPPAGDPLLVVERSPGLLPHPLQRGRNATALAIRRDREGVADPVLPGAHERGGQHRKRPGAPAHLRHDKIGQSRIDAQPHPLGGLHHDAP